MKFVGVLAMSVVVMAPVVAQASGLALRKNSGAGQGSAVAGAAEEVYEQLAAHGKPDLFLSDVMLPAGHRGPEIVTGARRNFGPVPAIFMSGHVSEGAIDSVREAGDFMLINKPFELAQMARQVRAVLDRNQG